MINFFKSLGWDLLFYGLLFVLLIYFLFRVRKDGYEKGKIEKTLEFVNQKRETLRRATRARREFGVNIQDLEQDDNVQYKNKSFGKVEGDGTIRNLSNNVCNSYECLQFKDSPFRRD